MKVIHTHLLQADTNLSSLEKLWVYNGLDCCITSEVCDALLGQLDPVTRATYNFSKQLQGPVLEMGLRGVKIDQRRRREVIGILSDRLDKLEQQLERIVIEGLGLLDFNWRSYKKLQELFYGRLKIPPIKKDGKPTTDRNALERIADYPIAVPIINHILALRDLAETISTLKTEIDPDGRVRTSYNIGGTVTGRFSSSFFIHGTGGNLQNVTEEVRSIFIADPGMKFAYIDKKSGESYMVGGIEWKLFKDPRYLDAVENGDVHTNVAKQVWPELPWTGDAKKDKILAEKPYHRHHTYRFMCKKLGHGSNYGGKPWTLGQQSHIETSIVATFQPKYFRAFPAHLRWHGWVENQLKTKGYLVTLTGRKRWFFGRRGDPETIREAIAYDPQGSLADDLNKALLTTWRKSIHGAPWQVLMQIHDAILVQYPEDREDEILPQILELMENDIDIGHGRTMRVPCEAKVGWNWGLYSEGNVDGLKDYVPGDRRRRSKDIGVMDRCFRDIR